MPRRSSRRSIGAGPARAALTVAVDPDAIRGDPRPRTQGFDRRRSIPHQLRKARFAPLPGRGPDPPFLSRQRLAGERADEEAEQEHNECSTRFHDDVSVSHYRHLLPGFLT